MINTHYLSVTALLSVLALSACDSSAPGMGAALPLGDDPVGQASQYLPTGVDAAEIDNAWFCTYTSDGEYIDRKELRLWETGSASVDGTPASWALDGVSLTIEYAGQTDQFHGVAFSTRLSHSDVFTASSDAGLDLDCDWSGPPRDLGFQNDGSNVTDIEELTGDTIDVLLSNGRSDKLHDAYWFCEIDPPSGNVFEMFLFDDGSMISTTDGRWSRLSSSSIELRTMGSVDVWSNVKIDMTEGQPRFNSFSADSDVTGPVVCNWSGKPRASAWTGAE